MFKIHGFSLLEILVALFVLSLLTLGLNITLLQTLKISRGALYAYIASEQARNIGEYMSLHAVLDEEFIQRLRQQVAQTLPSGELYVQQGRGVISIDWGGSHAGCQQNLAGVSGCLLITLPVKRDMH